MVPKGAGINLPGVDDERGLWVRTSDPLGLESSVAIREERNEA